MFGKLRDLVKKVGDNKSDYFIPKDVFKYRLEIMPLNISPLIRLQKLKLKCCCEIRCRKLLPKIELPQQDLTLMKLLKNKHFLYLKPNEKTLVPLRNVTA